MEPHGQPFDKLRVFLNVEVVPSEVAGSPWSFAKADKFYDNILRSGERSSIVPRYHIGFDYFRIEGYVLIENGKMA